ncbi:MAG: acylphosphatase [Candidatus Omnitrophica bacterium]|nr:acylphosphatase [Candidatus Omnitrophota bacterium]
MNKQIHLLISGFVQGVFFRASVAQSARALKLSGFVRNLSNGSVELVAEGQEEALRTIAEWCRRGPPGAQVKDVHEEWGDAEGRFEGFQIR